MALTSKDIEAILSLMENSGYDEIKLESGDFKLDMRKYGTGEADLPSAPRPQADAPAPAPAAEAIRTNQPAAPATAPKALEEKPQQTIIPPGCIAVRSPMLGTFYRSSSPDKAPFVEVGSKVTPEETIGLVEVMKLFNSISAETKGTVVDIPVENGALVEFGQILVIIKPDE